MKKTNILYVLSALCVAAAIGGSLIFSSHSARERRTAELSLKQARQSVAETQAALGAANESSGLLLQKVTQLTETLTNVTGQLRTAEEQLKQQNDFAEQERGRHLATERKQLADVPEPTVAVSTSKSGTQTKSFTFPKILDNKGTVLGSDAKFLDVIGTALTFRTADNHHIVTDVDSVHPAVLFYLGLNADTIKRKKMQTDAAWQRQQSAAYAQAAIEREAQARIAIEQAKANAEIARQRAEEDKVREASENERMKARAAVLAAEAAMVAAQNPAPGVVIQNQNANQNINRR